MQDSGYSQEVKNIFRAYDIRGLYGNGLDETVAENLGKSIGTYLGDGKLVGIGRDVRPSSGSLHDAFVKGLLSTGCSVIDFGEVPTPLLYFGTRHRKLDCGVMITASHLPPEWNGFKISDNRGITMSDEAGLNKIKEIFLSDRFSTSKMGSIRQDEIKKDYVKFVSSKVRIGSNLKAVFDFGNSVTSLVVPRIMEELRLESSKINKELDGTSPNRASEPSEESLQGLKNKVLAEHADIGIGYDGDGDRVAFVDERGNIFASGNITIPLLAKPLLRTSPGGKIVYDITCSSAVGDYIKNLGGVPFVVRVGHSYCASEVMNQKALFGGQYSGHTAFPEMNCADDAIFGSLKILETLSDSGRKLSELVDEIPRYFTSELKEIKCDDEAKFVVIERIKSKSANLGYKTIEIDGIVLYNGKGRVLIRASNTAPMIKINAEGKTKRACESFQKLGERLVETEVNNG